VSDTHPSKKIKTENCQFLLFFSIILLFSKKKEKMTSWAPQKPREISLYRLPPDLLRLIGSKLSLEYLLKLSGSSAVLHKKICLNDEFWIDLLMKKKKYSREDSYSKLLESRQSKNYMTPSSSSVIHPFEKKAANTSEIIRGLINIFILEELNSKVTYEEIVDIILNNPAFLQFIFAGSGRLTSLHFNKYYHEGEMPYHTVVVMFDRLLNDAIRNRKLSIIKFLLVKKQFLPDERQILHYLFTCIRINSKKIFKYLVIQLNITLAPKAVHSLVRESARYGSLSIMKYLISTWSYDPNEWELITAFNLSISSVESRKEIVSLLLETFREKITSNIIRQITQRTAEVADIDLFQYIVNFLSVDVENVGYLVAFAAVKQGHYHFLVYLLSSGKYTPYRTGLKSLISSVRKIILAQTETRNVQEYLRILEFLEEKYKNLR
jgi:hypothetical protein